MKCLLSGNEVAAEMLKEVEVFDIVILNGVSVAVKTEQN